MIDLANVTDKDIFDAIRYRRGKQLLDEHVKAINAILYPKGQPVASTWDREALEVELTRDEGKRLRAYKDTKGKWTIGIGHNLDDCGAGPLQRTVADILAHGIDEDENDALFDWDIARTEKDLDRCLPWWRSLNPVRQRVILNMCFNMGIGNAKHGLLSFTRTLPMIQRGEYSKAADAMVLSKWEKDVGMRAHRLADMMRGGK